MVPPSNLFRWRVAAVAALLVAIALRDAAAQADRKPATTLTLTAGFANKTLFDQAGVALPGKDATWDDWAHDTSKNPNVKVLLGIPANTGAAGSGYTSGSALAGAIDYAKGYSSFGGVMMWDMSQLYANTGFLAEVTADLQ